MENLKQRWQQCLQMLREKIKDPWVFNTWLAPIIVERYDEQQNTVLLQVPSKYVYEYLEHYCSQLLKWVLEYNFQPGINMQYRIMEQHTPGFIQVEDYLRQHGLDIAQPRPQTSISDARERMREALQRHIGPGYQWLPAYDRIADWLSDNRGRGLLCVGASGTGKTFLCKRILPVILGRADIPFVSAPDMHKNIDTFVKNRIVIIDDLGREPEKVYGERNLSFLRLCDAAEQNGNILIITTQLSTTPVRDPRYPTSIQERYGTDVLDRLRAVTRAVLFEGKSLR